MSEGTGKIPPPVSSKPLYFCVFASSPALFFIGAVTAWQGSVNQIAGNDCAFPSTQLVNALIVPVIVRALTIDLKRSFPYYVCKAWSMMLSPTYSQPSFKHLLQTFLSFFLSRLN